MIRKFLFSSIGLSLIAAILIIGTGIYFKGTTTAPKNSVRAKIDLIAQNSLKNAIESGQVDTSDWEKALEAVSGTTTVDEKIANLQGIYAESETEDDESLTATDRFSRALLKKYVDFKNSGGVITENTTIEFVNELLLEDYGGPEFEESYTKASLALFDTTSTADLKKYGNDLGYALNRPTSIDYENEIVIVNKVYVTDDASYLKKLPENLARYEDIRRLASQILVPRDVADAHVALLNSLSAIIEGVKGMMLIDEDPIGAAKLMLSYEIGLKSIDPSIKIISNYLKNSNVEFSSTESGYIFLK